MQTNDFLQQPYNRDTLLSFLREQFLPDDFSQYTEIVKIPFRPQHIKAVTLLGKSDILKLRLYEICHDSENDPRVSLSKDTFRLMSSYGCERALVLFTSGISPNYRLSLVTVDLILEGNHITREYSNPRRYSFYLGPDAKTNTAYQSLVLKTKVNDIDELISRFGVEIVTKQFFEDFRDIFERVKIEFEKTNRAKYNKMKDAYPENEYKEQVNKFAFTFLGRLIFIYFLQRKGWIEDNKNYIRDHVADKQNTNLYSDFLEPLFFDVFAKKVEERPKAIRAKYKNTPYLNGGLFERSVLEDAADIIILNDTFIRDIIDNFFEVYNFTIDENTPLDQEVSIDPEMLGKVFENTLAEEERSAKGTFYTPREIVHFMVKDALLQYLCNHTLVAKNVLHELIYHEITKDLRKADLRLLDEALDKVRVLDPAVGSAAFPVEMMHVLVHLRKLLNVSVGNNINEVTLKKQFIKKNLYGVDIDSGAAEISKLRLWLALIVDYNKEEAEPLPNLDFQFRGGNSLLEKVAGIQIVTDEYLSSFIKLQNLPDQLEMGIVPSKPEQLGFALADARVPTKLEKMREIVNEYFSAENEDRKKELKQHFDKIEHEIFEARISDLKDELHRINGTEVDHDTRDKLFSQKLAEIDTLARTVRYNTHKLFIPKLHFAEIFHEKGGFDIVIGNPPYGVKVDDDIKDAHGLGSKDSYGVFLASALRRFAKPGGVISFIVSDTWLTIKSHRELREQVLSNTLHKVVRLHHDCFDATVNACVVVITKGPNNNNNNIIAADFTNVSTRTEVPELRERLYHLDSFVGQTTTKYAIYKYPQDLIKTNANLPIFLASQKLFAFMNDSAKNLEKEVKIICGRQVEARTIKINGKVIPIVKLGDIAEVRQGLATGDNDTYLFQNPMARGSYRSIEDYKKYLLTDTDLNIIRKDESLRLEIVQKGISKNDKHSIRYFGGRYIIPYDKGGESDAEGGWMPNYYVPTNYFIDWSEWSVNAMKTRISKKQSGKIASRFQNYQSYFQLGVTFSDTGYYAPTFRLGSGTVYDVMGMTVFSDSFQHKYLISLTSSKFTRYIIKNVINHTVHTQVEGLKPIPLTLLLDENKINVLVKRIIEKQTKSQQYDYASHEQIEIDRLVYASYGLNAEDIEEIENWFARRYPKLSAAQRENLRKLGKSDDYLVLYGLKQ